jgi:hypothetical protein
LLLEQREEIRTASEDDIRARDLVVRLLEQGPVNDTRTADRGRVTWNTRVMTERSG